MSQTRPPNNPVPGRWTIFAIVVVGLVVVAVVVLLILAGLRVI